MMANFRKFREAKAKAASAAKTEGQHDQGISVYYTPPCSKSVTNKGGIIAYMKVPQKISAKIDLYGPYR